MMVKDKESKNETISIYTKQAAMFLDRLVSF
jgi:hypothetical protein